MATSTHEASPAKRYPTRVADLISARRHPNIERQTITSNAVIRYQEVMPGPIFRLAGGNVSSRKMEADIYSGGNPNLVPQIIQDKIFPGIDFAKLNPQQVLTLLAQTNGRIKGLELNGLGDGVTEDIIFGTLIMAHRTSDPRAIGEVDKTIRLSFPDLQKRLPQYWQPGHQPPFTYLDIGSGGLTLTMRVREALLSSGIPNPLVVAVEPSPVNRQVAHTLYPNPPQVHVVDGDGTALAQPAQEFWAILSDHQVNQPQLVTCFDVEHHLPYPQIVELRRNILETVDPKGLVIQSDPAPNRGGQLMVDLITRRDLSHQGPQSFAAAVPIPEQIQAWVDATGKVPDKFFDISLVNTGFMVVTQTFVSPRPY